LLRPVRDDATVVVVVRRLTLSARVGSLELQVEPLLALPNRVAAVEVAIAQLREEMRASDDETRGLIRASEMETRRLLWASEEETRSQMRVLHEEVIARIALLGENLNGRRKPRNRR
jgi:hypothetical protein